MTHHDPNIDRAHDRPGNTIATRGAPKRMEPVSVHAGMTRRQMDMNGIGHAIGSAPDASADSPLDKTAPGKTFSPARPMIGQRSRIMDTAHGGQPRPTQRLRLDLNRQRNSKGVSPRAAQ